MNESELLALAQQTPAAERALLEHACEGQPELRQRMEAALAEASSPSADPAVPTVTIFSPPLRQRSAFHLRREAVDSRRSIVARFS